MQNRQAVKGCFVYCGPERCDCGIKAPRVLDEEGVVTIEEIAREIAEQTWANAYENRPALARRFAAALSAAIQAEREACAVDAVANSGAFNEQEALAKCDDFSVGYHRGRRAAAAAIRSRK